MKTRFPVPVLILVVAVGLVGLGAFLNSRADKSPVGDQDAQTSADANATRRDASGATGAQTGAQAGGDDAMMLAEATPPPDVAPETGEFTRPSKMDYIRTSFKGFETPLEDYKLEGLEASADGIRLAEPKPGEDPARLGVIHSPTLPLKHPSNMVLPLWRGQVPDGTTLQVEVATSADGENWTQWFAVDVAHDDISPTYPDGSPNPNYGATPGTPVGFGMELYPYFRYRVTMASADASSPLLQNFEVFHTDSTDGEGFLANDPPPERAIIQAASDRTSRP